MVHSLLKFKYYSIFKIILKKQIIVNKIIHVVIENDIILIYDKDIFYVSNFLLTFFFTNSMV